MTTINLSKIMREERVHDEELNRIMEKTVRAAHARLAKLVSPPTLYSDELRSFIAAKLGYSPSDLTIDFIVLHNLR